VRSSLRAESQRMRAILHFCLLLPAVAQNFLVVSSPRLARIVALPLQDNQKKQQEPIVVVETGLKQPQGIAIDQNRRRLYVADVGARNVLYYDFNLVNGEVVTQADPVVVADNVEAHWVAVDGVGNVFFTEERVSQIFRIPAPKGVRGKPKPVAIYTSEMSERVSSPGGIAVDDFNVWWGNKELGTQVGALIVAPQEPPAAAPQDSMKVLASVTDRVNGVCVAAGNVFFMSDEILATRKAGGVVAVISDVLQQPRGCAWDMDGGMYVADKGTGQIVKFPGALSELKETRLTPVVSVEDAYGLAVIVSSSWVSGCSAVVLCALAWLHV